VSKAFKTQGVKAAATLLQIDDLCVDGPNTIKAIRAVLDSYFAEANNAEFRCEYCHHAFAVGRGSGRRTTARYCSDRCRNRVFREKRALALVPA